MSLPSYTPTLVGDVIRLEPLTLAHLPGLVRAGLEPELWLLTVAGVASPEEMRTYVETALRAREAGTAVPFAVVAIDRGQPIGSTRFANIDWESRHVEIGWTWIGLPWQRTAVNTEAKYLMLKHAFEAWDCVRVEFKTDVLNIRSRQALRRIGAREEGVLRKHMRTWTGRIRDSVYYSIIDEEWPGVKSDLERKLAGR